MEVFQVAYLMGGDDDDPVFGGTFGDDAAQGGLRGDVQTVGRLVHQQHLGVQCQCKGYQCLFLLPLGKPVEPAGGIYFEGQAQSVKHGVVVLRVEQ